MFEIGIFVSVSNIKEMNQHKKQKDKGDPSEIHQRFPSYNLQVLCCRYWWLRKWEFTELSFPYWRIYWNKKRGATITYAGQDYELQPDKIFIIAPNTPYATKLFRKDFPKEGFELEGDRIHRNIVNNQSFKCECIYHLFIHFNIGFPYDLVAPGVYQINIDNYMNQKISMIIDHLLVSPTTFNFSSALNVQSLISDLLSKIPDSIWKDTSRDFRILNIFYTIDSCINQKLSNSELAKMINLSTNAFIRLFKKEVGISPQKYVQKKRINQACMLLHRSTKTIDEVGFLTGFANRYHFSRIFKSQIGLSPAAYKKSVN